MIIFARKVLNYLKNREKISKWQIYSSHASLYVLISSVPALMLFIMIFMKMSKTETALLLETLKDRLPGQLADYFPEDFIKNAMTASIPGFSLTALLMLWSSSKGTRAISEGLRSIYDAPDEEPLWYGYLRSLLLTVIFFVVLAVALILLVFGETIVSTFRTFQSRYFDLTRLLARLGWLFSFMLFTLAFALIYKFMAGRRFPLSKHLPGAAFASSGWLIYSALMSLYLRFFTPEKYILYGSLGALLLLMLWVKSCMSIFFFGAELNVLLLYRPTVIGRKQSFTKQP